MGLSGETVGEYVSSQGEKIKSENGKKAITWIGNNKPLLFRGIEIAMVSLLLVIFTSSMGSTADADDVSEDMNNVEASSKEEVVVSSGL